MRPKDENCREDGSCLDCERRIEVNDELTHFRAEKGAYEGMVGFIKKRSGELWAEGKEDEAKLLRSLAKEIDTSFVQPVQAKLDASLKQQQARKRL